MGSTSGRATGLFSRRAAPLIGAGNCRSHPTSSKNSEDEKRLSFSCRFLPSFVPFPLHPVLTPAGYSCGWLSKQAVNPRIFTGDGNVRMLFSDGCALHGKGEDENSLEHLTPLDKRA